jgi:hypothetical protein
LDDVGFCCIRRKQEEWERNKREQVAKEAQLQGEFPPASAEAKEEAGKENGAEKGWGEENGEERSEEKHEEKKEAELLVVEEEEGDTELAAWKDGLNSMLMPPYELATIERRAKTMSGAIGMVGTEQQVPATKTEGADSDQNNASPTEQSFETTTKPSAVDYSREIEEMNFLEKQSSIWTEEAVTLRRLVRPGMKQLLSFLAYTLHTNRRYLTRILLYCILLYHTTHAFEFVRCTLCVDMFLIGLILHVRWRMSVRISAPRPTSIFSSGSYAHNNLRDYHSNIRVSQAEQLRQVATNRGHNSACMPT